MKLKQYENPYQLVYVPYNKTSGDHTIQAYHNVVFSSLHDKSKSFSTDGYRKTIMQVKIKKDVDKYHRKIKSFSKDNDSF